MITGRTTAADQSLFTIGFFSRIKSKDLTLACLDPGLLAGLLAFNKPLVIALSSKGGREIRYVALGKTYGSRLLTVVFTVRANRVRVISARPMSRNERKVYEKEN